MKSFSSFDDSTDKRYKNSIKSSQTAISRMTETSQKVNLIKHLERSVAFELSTTFSSIPLCHRYRSFLTCERRLHYVPFLDFHLKECHRDSISLTKETPLIGAFNVLPHFEKRDRLNDFVGVFVLLRFFYFGNSPTFHENAMRLAACQYLTVYST